jgi:hypothetical protein
LPFPGGEEAVGEPKKLGISASLDAVVLDVTDDSSIIKSKDAVEKKYEFDSMVCHNNINDGESLF